MAYKAGAKAQAYPISEELHPTLSANRHDASVLIAPVYAPIVMASGQSNAEIEYDMAPAQSAMQYKDPLIVCMADDNANAAIDVDLCGSLKVGGGRPCIAYRATETTSSAHSAPATSRESETSTSARGR
jgi:hypothetical protein